MNPDGTQEALRNYYDWQTWTDSSGTYVIIVSYPFQPGKTTFLVNGATPPPAQGQVTLAWSPPTTIVGYRLSWGLTNGGPYPNVVNAGLVYQWTFIGLPSGLVILQIPHP